MKNTINPEYLQGKDENEARLSFCLDIVEATKVSACTFKPNQQYVMGWTKKDHQRLTAAIRRSGSVSILDYKLGDIGDTIESALFHIREWGYDALTFNPFLGNLESTVEQAHTIDPRLGILVLALTSNPEAVRYQKDATFSGRPLYLVIAEDVKRFGADGCVVGVTANISEDNMRRIRSVIGEESVILIPGVGTQRGDLQVVKAAGANILVNVSRDIIYSKDPRGKAEEYRIGIRDAVLAKY